MTQWDSPRDRGADVAAVVFALLFPTVVTLLYFVVLAPAAATIQQAVYVLGKVLQFSLPAVWVFVVQRRSLQRPAASRLWLLLNLLFGGLVVGLMMVLYHAWLRPSGYLAPQSPAGEAILEKVQQFGVDRAWKYAALAVFYAVVHSGLEEYYWRWFVFGESRRLMPLGSAIFVSSVGFMLHHVIVLGTYFHWALAPTAFFSLCVALGGAVWCWLYHRAGSLLGPWLSHLLIDAGIFLIGYDLVRGAI